MADALEIEIGKSYSFTVPGEPQGMPRPRFNRKTGTAYTPAHAATDLKTAIRFAAAAAVPFTALPVAVAIEAYFTRPKARRRDQWKVSKPDIDNVIKTVLDALTGVVFKDDAQVAGVTAFKLYAEPGEAPRTQIKIMMLSI